MKLPPFDYACPATVEEAVALLGASDGLARPLAGGQSLIPLLAFRLAAPKLLVDLAKLPGLDRIETSAEGVRLGAMARWRNIEDDPRLLTAHPLLVEAVRHVAHYQIRNRGTVGGSLAHADPAAELPGIAAACVASLSVTGPRGAREIPADAFFLGPLATALADDEIITHLHLPPWPPARRWAFEEFARRRGDFAIAGVALFYDQDEAGRALGAHVGVIGADDRPRRLVEVEALLEGHVVDGATITAASRVAAASVAPTDDVHASAEYRRALVATLTERALRRASA
jgi:carbon-monoxide dehydrogenase medium subunit